MSGLEQSKLFRSLNEAELQLLRESCVEREFPAGSVIFQEGDAGDGIYIVNEGQVQISALVGQDARRVLSRINPRDFFGEMAVLDEEPRSATATAEVSSETTFIPREALLRMIDVSPRLAVSLVREFSLRMREFNRQYIEEVLQAERLTLVGKFARSIVHDFKNPLNIIGLAAELINMEQVSPQMRLTATDRIRKQVDRLANMCNELLEFTRGPESGIVLSAFDYGGYVSKLIEELRPDIKDRGAEIVLRNEPPSAMVPLDQKRFLHVFTNLFFNAADAMQGDGQIFLSFQLTPTEVVTEVEDTGKGIAPEIFPRMFEAFTTYGKMRGTGLGLSICKKIIEDHRGWIRARNEPGRGAIFTFGLPLAVTPA